MSTEFLINFTPQETRVAIVEQGVVQELHIERTACRGNAGNVYLGKVVRVLPGMQSAFIAVGLERTAFLHVADIWSERQNGEAPRPIERILSEGQSLMVQVLKDPIGTKGARLSTQISLAGRLLVYLPQEKHIGITQRIENEAERDALRARLSALVPADEPGGFIVRTMAESASDAELSADIVDKGIVMTGGGAMLANLDLLLREATGLPVMLAEDPLTAVVLGTGRCLDELYLLREVAVRS